MGQIRTRAARVAWATLALAALALVPLPLTATPAAAHGGKINLVVAGDGATGVTARATYADGHALDQSPRLVLNATGEGGRKVGPVQLNPTGEGQGFYSSGPLLAPGRWQVTVTAPEPTPASVVVVVEARAAQTAPPVAAAPISAAEGDAARWMWWVAGAALAVAAVAGVLLLFRVRRDAATR
ncbi:hypothetical protein AB0J86_35050 [Micromonospora sp. NPDC049559]|uniref:hypothetical protein n=1 Tax=Micromonospora sp. NPDC049559 TaxID=3155923 RepID=UPI00342355DD